MSRLAIGTRVTLAQDPSHPSALIGTVTGHDTEECCWVAWDRYRTVSTSIGTRTMIYQERDLKIVLPHEEVIAYVKSAK